LFFSQMQIWFQFWQFFDYFDILKMSFIHSETKHKNHPYVLNLNLISVFDIFGLSWYSEYQEFGPACMIWFKVQANIFTTVSAASKSITRFKSGKATQKYFIPRSLLIFSLNLWNTLYKEHPHLTKIQRYWLCVKKASKSVKKASKIERRDG